MNADKLIPKVRNRVQFNLKHQELVPKEAGCYVLATFDGEILYIGQSDNLNRQFAEDRNTKEKCVPTPEGTAFWFYHRSCNEREISRIERSWLNQHMFLHGTFPPLNKIIML